MSLDSRIGFLFYGFIVLVFGISIFLNPHEPVTDEGDAVGQAHAIWNDEWEATSDPVFSPDAVGKQEPFHATLNNGIWIVEGTPRQDDARLTLSAKIVGEARETTVYVGGKLWTPK